MKELEITGLISETQKQHFTPTLLGKKIGMSAVKFNQALEYAGMQVGLRDHKDRIFWKATEKGMKYCMIIDTGKRHVDGAPVEQLKWSEDVIDAIGRPIKIQGII